MKTIVSAIALVAALSTTAFAGKTQNFYVWDQEAQAFVLSYTVVDTRTTLEIMIEKQQKEIAREDKPAGVSNANPVADDAMETEVPAAPTPAAPTPAAPTPAAPTPAAPTPAAPGGIISDDTAETEVPV